MSNDIEWINVTEEDTNAALRFALVIEWSSEDDAFIVTVPDIPGLHTHGNTREEAATMGNEAIALWIAAARTSNEPAPVPTFSALRLDWPPRHIAEDVREIRQRLDVSQRDFAEMLNVSLGTVRSWEQGLRRPDGASQRLLDIAEHQPDALLNASSLATSRR